MEQLSYTSHPVDHLHTARRLWTATQRTAHAAAAERAEAVTTSVGQRHRSSPFTRSTTFRRLIDVPGDCLDTILEAWWTRSSHDDGHLRVRRISSNQGMFELHGTLRTGSVLETDPRQIRLSPYLGSWSFLELNPQRPTHASRIFFRTGHDSLDRFVAALCALV